MSGKNIELRPDRSLLEPTFDGYKLSLQNPEVLQLNLNAPVDKLFTELSNFSLLHARLFTLHNHLVGDSISDVDSVYFVDVQFKVQKTYKDSLSNKLSECICVWQIPRKRKDNDFYYNVTFKFISDSLCVLADGTDTVYILDTGVRSNDDSWTMLFSGEVIGPGKKFEIADAVYEGDHDPPVIHLLLVGIHLAPNKGFIELLHWVTLSKIGNIWGQIAIRELKANGTIRYSYFERNCEALYVVSDNGCQFHLDSENPIQGISKTLTEQSIKYAWKQNTNEILIAAVLEEGALKESVKITCHIDFLDVDYKERTVVSGKLYAEIKSELTTWGIKDSLLSIKLIKDEEGLIWPEFIVGDSNGHYIARSPIVKGSSELLETLTGDNEATPQAGITFNTEEVEDCDFEEDKSSIFERLSVTTHEVTHKAILGSNQVILTAVINRDMPPAIGIRHDVDVCLWQPEGTGNDFNIRHAGTLNAFGYIQASKRQKKYMVCPPDLSYAAVCEATRHLFLYRQNKPVDSSVLRNRTSGRNIRNVAQQQVISLGNDEIIGIYASNSMLFLLTGKSVFAVLL